MAAFNKFQQFVQNVGDGVMNLNSDQLFIMLTNTAPNAADTVYNASAAQVQPVSNAPDLSTANGYTAGGTISSGTAYSQSGGTATLSGGNVVFTASGGSIGPFRYVVMYDKTAGTSTTRPLIGWWDYGSSITVTNGNTFTVNLSANILTLA